MFWSPVGANGSDDACRPISVEVAMPGGTRVFKGLNDRVRGAVNVPAWAAGVGVAAAAVGLTVFGVRRRRRRSAES